ncbi:NPHP1 protein [Pelomyxa schiedti]|nr:NPHP1 protein [Pelomyxa schiedti]
MSSTARSSHGGRDSDTDGSRAHAMGSARDPRSRSSSAAPSASQRSSARSTPRTARSAIESARYSNSGGSGYGSGYGSRRGEDDDRDGDEEGAYHYQSETDSQQQQPPDSEDLGWGMDGDSETGGGFEDSASPRSLSLNPPSARTRMTCAKKIHPLHQSTHIVANPTPHQDPSPPSTARSYHSSSSSVSYNPPLHKTSSALLRKSHNHLRQKMTHTASGSYENSDAPSPRTNTAAVEYYSSGEEAPNNEENYEDEDVGEDGHYSDDPTSDTQSRSPPIDAAEPEDQGATPSIEYSNQDENEDGGGGDYEQHRHIGSHQHLDTYHYHCDTSRLPRPQKSPAHNKHRRPARGVSNAQSIFKKIVDSKRRIKFSLWYLKDFGPMPISFRPSTLAQLVKKGPAAPSVAVIPALSPSQLSFSDLTIDFATQDLRQRHHRACFKISLGSAREIPNPGPQAEVISRRVRVCLWRDVGADSSSVGNCHTVMAILTEMHPTISHWRFKSKQGVWIQRHDENTFLVRSNSPPDLNLKLLFELCILVRNVNKQPKNSIKSAELSCGWAMLPLFPQGQLLQMKSYELPLQGGTPKDIGIPLETLLPRTGKEGRPILNIKLSELGRSERSEAAYLPDVIVTSFSTAPLICEYRRELLDALVLQRTPSHGFVRCGALGDSVLEPFLRILDDWQLLEAAKRVWHEACENNGAGTGGGLVNSVRREKGARALARRQAFRQAITTLWPLLHCLPAIHEPEGDAEGNPHAGRRYDTINAYLSRSFPTALLVSNGIGTVGGVSVGAIGLAENTQGFEFEPFVATELRYQHPQFHNI